MSATTECSPCCPTKEIVDVPGVEGAPGTNGAAGADGVNAFTVTTSPNTTPNIGDPVTLIVADSTWAVVGQNVFVAGAGYFSVTSKPTVLSLVLTYLDYAVNSNTGNAIAAGAGISPGGLQIVVANPGTLTDNTTGAASNTLAAGVGCQTLAFPIQLAAMTTAAADLLTNYVVGFAFKILSVSFVTTTISAGAGGSQILNLEINSTNVTGGVVTITLAGSDTLGELTAGTAITAANIGSATDTLSVEVAAGGTVFTAGAGMLLIKVQNLDSADAVASLASKVNTLISALTT